LFGEVVYTLVKLFAKLGEQTTAGLLALSKEHSHMKLTPFGETVRLLRMRHDVSMKSMAEAMGISSSYLSGIEYGEKTLADKYVDAALQFFRGVASDAELQSLRQAAERSKE